MTDDQIALLERRMARLEGELDRAHRRVAALEQGSGRTLRLGRLAGACALGALAVLALGTAAAAPSPQPLAAAAPFKVVGKGGQMLFTIDADGARFFHAGHPVAGMGWGAAGTGGVLYVADGGGHTTAQIGSVGTGDKGIVRAYGPRRFDFVSGG